MDEVLNNPVPALQNAGETIAVITHLSSVMDDLLAIIDKETELVRAGQLTEAAELETAKSELAYQYVMDTKRLKANEAFVAQVTPEEMRGLRDRHELFQALLQVNLTVLATAHAVSESIMRGVSDEMNRKAVPQTYGASGRQSAPPRNVAQPLAVSRVL